MEGYGGFAKALEDPSYMIDLTKQSVKNIHHVGGSILRSSRYSLFPYGLTEIEEDSMPTRSSNGA